MEAARMWQVTFHLADAMEQPFPDGHFDLVWCMDAADHMPDKEKVRISIS